MYGSEQYILMAEQALQLAKAETCEQRRRTIVDIALAWSRLAAEERSFASGRPPASALEHRPA